MDSTLMMDLRQKRNELKNPLSHLAQRKSMGWGMKSLVITMKAEVKVKRIMKAVEAEVIEPLAHQRGRVRLETYPIIIFISEKIFLGLSNWFQKKIYM